MKKKHLFYYILHFLPPRSIILQIILKSAYGVINRPGESSLAGRILNLWLVCMLLTSESLRIRRAKTFYMQSFDYRIDILHCFYQIRKNLTSHLFIYFLSMIYHNFIMTIRPTRLCNRWKNRLTDESYSHNDVIQHWKCTFRKVTTYIRRYNGDRRANDSITSTIKASTNLQQL